MKKDLSLRNISNACNCRLYTIEWPLHFRPLLEPCYIYMGINACVQCTYKNQSLMNHCMSLRTNLNPMICPFSRILAGIKSLANFDEDGQECGSCRDFEDKGS